MILDANLGPTWDQVGAKLIAKLGPKLHHLSKLLLESISELLGFNFDAFSGIKSMLKLYLSWEVKKLEKLILANTRTQSVMSQGCGKSMII